MPDAKKPRPFALHREEDASGVSGVGYVAYGVEFYDGVVVMRWDTETSSTAVYTSIEDLESIHGHGGRTEVVWFDETRNARREND